MLSGRSSYDNPAFQRQTPSSSFRGSLGGGGGPDPGYPGLDGTDSPRYVSFNNDPPGQMPALAAYDNETDLDDESFRSDLGKIFLYVLARSGLSTWKKQFFSDH